MIYLDSSALMKLVREEAETEALRDWLVSQPEVPVITSELGRVEVLRAASRAGSDALIEARAVIADVDLVPLNRAVQDIACELGDSALRTHDALHVASAMLLGDELTALAAYDDRLLTAARAAGLPTTTPRPAKPMDERESDSPSKASMRPAQP